MFVRRPGCPETKIHQLVSQTFLQLLFSAVHGVDDVSPGTLLGQLPPLPRLSPATLVSRNLQGLTSLNLSATAKTGGLSSTTARLSTAITVCRLFRHLSLLCLWALSVFPWGRSPTFSGFSVGRRDPLSSTHALSSYHERPKEYVSFGRGCACEKY